MKIKDLFLKPIDREIEGVIKADDLESLKIEVEEYVVTNEIAKYLMYLMEQYNKPNQGNNGVWISGFFGSGKSHLLKMLALFLENRQIDDLNVAETLISKVPPSDAILKAEMNKALGVPSQSILFNIDQKADAIGANQEDAVLRVFAKVFDDFCGYYGQHGFIAKFERDLDAQGHYQKFKDIYQVISGKSWHEGREAFNLNRKFITQAYAKLSGNPLESAKDIIQSYREDYHLSIEDFAHNVNKYIQQQGKGFRLNFFVDEVGQYVAENIKLMTNLQTIVESLATICKGQSWLFVTSQEDMTTVLGQFGQKQSNDFSRIQARFNCKMHLSSQDVAEVIQKRLLAKSEEGAHATRMIYAKEHQNFGTLFSFPDEGMNLGYFRDEANFVNSYPFIPYQYTLFQQSIENLSKHNAFTGKHNSVGERSMLGVFQDVVKAIADEDFGALGSFDLMFEGIRSAIKSSNQRAILTAETNLSDPFAKRVLKALFMVKYIKSFKATVRNLRVLMQTHFDEDIKGLEARIAEALSLLEKETYIQRNNDIYEYLTEEEQDIESDIKAVVVDNEEIYKSLEDLFFVEIIRDNKIRYEDNLQDYAFSKRIDEKLRGRDHELSIDFITPFSEFSDDHVALKAHCMGKAELMVVIPSDAQFMQDLLMVKRTDIYIKQNNGVRSSETRQTILLNKASQNIDRKKAVSRRLMELIAQAVFIVSGDQVAISGEDAKARVIKAFNVLVNKVYPHLRMLGGVQYSENDIKRYLEPAGNTLFNSDALSFNEAELEMLTFIQNNQQLGERTTMKKIEDRFSARPYGWYLAAIQCITAMLAGRGKIECWVDGTLQENGPLEKALKNTYGFSNLIIDPKKSVDIRKVKVLKQFFSDFFSEPTSENDARNLVKNIKARMSELRNNRLLVSYQLRSRYPFMSRLKPVMDQIDILIAKDFDYFITSFEEDCDSWLDLKEKEIDPLLSFMGGQKQEIYDTLVEFLSLKKPDLPGEDITKLEEIIGDPQIYMNNRLQQAKVTLDGIKARIEKRLELERSKALDNIDRLQKEMQQMQDYQALTSDQKQNLDHSFEQVTYTIRQQSLAVSIREKVSNYEIREYTDLLTKLHKLASPPEIGRSLKIIHINEIQVPSTKKMIENDADAQEYCNALKASLLEAIANHKHIKL